jgi:hypothetical protein
MTKAEKAELLSHYEWLLTCCAPTFTKKEKDMNKKIWEILFNIKTKENKDDQR